MPNDLQKWQARAKELQAKEQLDEAEKRELADLKGKIAEAEADDGEEERAARSTATVEVRMPRDLRETVRDRAEERRISTNAFIVRAVEDALAGRRASAEGLAELQQLCALHKGLSDSGQTQAAKDLERIIKAKTEDLCETNDIEPAPASSSRAGSSGSRRGSGSGAGENRGEKRDPLFGSILSNLVRR